MFKILTAPLPENPWEAARIILGRIGTSRDCDVVVFRLNGKTYAPSALSNTDSAVRCGLIKGAEIIGVYTKDADPQDIVDDLRA